MSSKKTAMAPSTFAGEAAFFQVFDDGLEARVVMALAKGVIESDAEAGIDAIELFL